MKDNVIPLVGSADGFSPQSASGLEEEARRLEQIDLQLREKAQNLRRLERAFERAHNNLEGRISERTQQLTEANAKLRAKASESARLEAVFEKVLANLEHRIEARALELVETNYAIGATVVEGPGHARAHGAGIRLVGQE